MVTAGASYSRSFSIKVNQAELVLVLNENLILEFTSSVGQSEESNNQFKSSVGQSEELISQSEFVSNKNEGPSGQNYTIVAGHTKNSKLYQFENHLYK